jgi:hypothetical protein
MKSMLRVGMMLLVLAWSLPAVHGQEGISRKQQEKNLAKKAKEEKKETIRREKEGKKRHLELQDKATRKRMKKNTKRADRKGSDGHGSGRSGGLFRRKR